MKIVFQTLLFFTTFLFPKCQSNEHKNVITKDVNITSPKLNYERGDEFSYNIINNKSSNLQYYVGLETYFKNSWIEVILDIDSTAPEKAAIIKTLQPNQSKTEVFSLLHYFKLNQKSNLDLWLNLKFKNYRFVLNYSTDNNNEFLQCYSNSFSIN